MLVLYVIALLSGFALGLRLMMGGVLKEAPPGAPESASAAATRRARARLLTPIAAAVLASFGLTGAALSRGTGWGMAAVLGTSLAVAGAAVAVAGWIRSWALDPHAPADPDDDPRYVVQGLPALVTGAIAAARAGEITWRRNGRTEVTPARTLDGADMTEGTEVVIDRLEDGVAWVESWRQVEARL